MADIVEDNVQALTQVYEEDRQVISPKSKLEIVPELKQGETFQMATSLVNKDSELPL